jgi:hypothetical protein
MFRACFAWPFEALLRNAPQGEVKKSEILVLRCTPIWAGLEGRAA